MRDNADLRAAGFVRIYTELGSVLRDIPQSRIQGCPLLRVDFAFGKRRNQATLDEIAGLELGCGKPSDGVNMEATAADRVRTALNHYGEQAQELGDTLDPQAVHRWHSVIAIRLLEAVEETAALAAEVVDDQQLEMEINAVAAVLATSGALELSLRSCDQLPAAVAEAREQWGLAVQMLAHAFPGVIDELEEWGSEVSSDDDQTDQDEDESDAPPQNGVDE